MGDLPSQHRNLLASASRAEQLVADSQAGKPGAFDALVKEYRPRVLALALHITGSASDADDVAQEVFLRAFHHMGGFEGRSQFFTWLYRVALNQSLNSRRRGHQRRYHLDDDRVQAAVAVDAVGDPRLALELRETYTLLLQGLDSLSEKLQATVVLVALQGLSYQEAAIVLETTEGTIAWRLNEARQQLRATIERLERRPAADREVTQAGMRELFQRFPRLLPELV